MWDLFPTAVCLKICRSYRRCDPNIWALASSRCKGGIIRSYRELDLTLRASINCLSSQASLESTDWNWRPCNPLWELQAIYIMCVKHGMGDSIAVFLYSLFILIFKASPKRTRGEKTYLVYDYLVYFDFVSEKYA